jgi:hypothetical protein
MDYGTDFKLVDDAIVFPPDGDVEIIFGPACVAQDIDQTLKITPGRLVWDKEAGSTLMLMLNDAGTDSNAVNSELERVAFEDQRVDPLSISAQRKTDKTFRMDFCPLGAVSSETLEYDLKEKQ